ncbi:hypothetical protein A2U01_0024112 [Trifolium medium]|uniref:Uncharacterized protein n=1 Tax=Trifolium medium TaxID=97028 RepID=A0A392NT88_9FABA|nr:hypothetical protein [Trifolium medium]
MRCPVLVRIDAVWGGILCNVLRDDSAEVIWECPRESDCK